MTLIITIFLILFIAVCAWIFNKALKINICVVCAGTAGTWISLSAARFAGYPADPMIIGILMGGSVVGIMYQIEKKRRSAAAPQQQPPPPPLLKLAFIIAGFSAVYSFLQYLWFPFFIAALLAAAAGLVLHRAGLIKPEKPGQHEKELMDKMKNCC